VFRDGEIDRRAYELCAFFELRSRDFENYLIPKPTFEILKAEGPLPVEVDTDVQRYLENRRSVLTQELATIALSPRTDNCRMLIWQTVSSRSRHFVLRHR